MLTKRSNDNRYQIEMNAIEDIVPKNHLLRKIEKAIDFNFIYDEVEDLYSKDIGRPSIDPVVLIKIILIQYLYGISSMRQTIKELKVNMAYRWFIGYSITEKILHFSTSSKNYERRFSNSNLFNNIFSTILEEADKHNYIHDEQVFIDATHVKASANKKKYVREEKVVEAKRYQKQLDEEIAHDRENHGKKLLKTSDSDSKKNGNL